MLSLECWMLEQFQKAIFMLREDWSSTVPWPRSRHRTVLRRRMRRHPATGTLTAICNIKTNNCFLMSSTEEKWKCKVASTFIKVENAESKTVFWGSWTSWSKLNDAQSLVLLSVISIIIFPDARWHKNYITCYRNVQIYRKFYRTF